MSTHSFFSFQNSQTDDLIHGDRDDSKSDGRRE